MNWLMYSLLRDLFFQNQDALLAIPTEVKTILWIAFTVWLVCALGKGTMKLVKYLVVAVAIYFGCVYFGIF